MAKIVVNNNLTLDGVMQAPGSPDEDRRGGLKQGDRRLRLHVAFGWPTWAGARGTKQRDWPASPAGDECSPAT